MQLRGLPPIAALGLALSGCESPREIPSGLTAEVQGQVQFCESMDENVEDWCVFQVLHDSMNVAAAPFYDLCHTMSDSGARDACLETLARTDEAFVFATLCEEIQQVRLRESCFLMRAEAKMRTNPSIYEVVSECQKTGSLTHHCLSHVPAQRQTLWQRQGGVRGLASDLQAMLKVDPEDSSVNGVGFAFGMALRDMGAGPQGMQVCSLFGGGDAMRACQEASSNGASNFSPGGALGGGPGGIAPP